MPASPLFYWVEVSVDTNRPLIFSARCANYIPHSLANRNLCYYTLDNQNAECVLCPVFPVLAGVSLGEVIGGQLVSLTPHSSSSRRNPPVLTWWNGCTTRHSITVHLEQLQVLLDSGTGTWRAGSDNTFCHLVKMKFVKHLECVA